MKNLYIDLGSTNIKYAVDGGEIFKTDFPAPIKKDEYKYEVAVADIMEIVQSIIREYAPDNVFFSVQMHGYILSDAQHNPVTEYISWRDTFFKGASMPYPFEVSKNSGTSAKNNLPLFSIYARMFADPTLKERTRYFDTLGSYIAYRLTGRHCVHITDACPTGFYLLPDGKLNRVFHGKEEFKNVNFPECVKTLCVIGKFGNTKVYVAVGDQQASAYGSGLTDREYLFNTGTASQLCCVSEIYVEGGFESRPYFGGKTLCTVSGLTGGTSFEEMEERAEAIKEEYRLALEKLPAREKILATGGLADYNEVLFKKIYLELVGDYVYINGQRAIEGLRKLSRTV